MVDDQTQLMSVVRDLARTITVDLPFREMLDHLVRRVPDAVMVAGAGVTLISSDASPEYVAASNEHAHTLERLQSTFDDGPRLSACSAGEPVFVPDLFADDRFPLFAPSARAAGVASVFSFPLRQGERCVGALDLYRESIGPMTSREILAAETVADLISAWVVTALALREATAASAAHLHGSLHDPLTGLPNRALLMDRLAVAQLRARHSQHVTAVFFVDLDRFELVNDQHGHHVGDLLLVALAERFVALLRAGDTVARISGDQFVFLCERLRADADPGLIASRIEAACALPFVLDGLRLSVSASVGVATAGPGDEVSPDLITQADTAMHLVRRHRGSRRHLPSAAGATDRTTT